MSAQQRVTFTQTTHTRLSNFCSAWSLLPCEVAFAFEPKYSCYNCSTKRFLCVCANTTSCKHHKTSFSPLSLSHGELSARTAAHCHRKPHSAAGHPQATEWRSLRLSRNYIKKGPLHSFKGAAAQHANVTQRSLHNRPLLFSQLGWAKVLPAWLGKRFRVST